MAGIAFSRDGRYLAVAERRDCKDYVSIFVCSDWQLLRVSAPPAGTIVLPSGQGAAVTLLQALGALPGRVGTHG